jgi:predicted amidohydrolase YtcJ
VFDGAGKTLVPGLWDSHQHVPGDSAGPMLLSLGITWVRTNSATSCLDGPTW